MKTLDYFISGVLMLLGSIVTISVFMKIQEYTLACVTYPFSYYKSEYIKLVGGLIAIFIGLFYPVVINKIDKDKESVLR